MKIIAQGALENLRNKVNSMEQKKKMCENDNAQLVFDQTFRKVLSIIEQNKSSEVTVDSNTHTAGIYMLFVDHFEDDRIVPFYIGQTSDFQKRHKQHFTEIMALNRLNRECYRYALFADLYNGHARPCKIFSYIVNHGCSLNDLHMIVLEEIDDEKHRLEAEQKYIDNLNAPFFGFNQLNSVLRYIEARFGDGDESEYNIAKNRDVDLLLQFSAFGYGAYNWYRSCESFYETALTIQPLREIPDGFIEILNSKRRLDDIRLRRIEITQYNGSQAENEVWKICQETITAFFAKRRLRSEDKKKLVVTVLLFDIEGNRRELEKYFAKYSDRVDEDIFEVIDHLHGKEIQPIKQRVLNNQCEYRALKEETEILNNVVIGTLLPIQYTSHPLGALEKNIAFRASGDEENVCYLNIEFSCFRADYNYDFYPEITRIDYLVIVNGNTQARTVYIDNPLSNFFDRDDVYYYEHGFAYGPFNPYLTGPIYTHIPVTMEYKNGINEWALQGKQTEDFRDVFKEINSLIDEKTKVIYSTSGYKSTILRFTDCVGISDTLLMKKLKCLFK